MKRLLCLLSETNVGGAETFIMKIYRNIDRSKYQIDFCVNVFEECYYDKEILSLGGRIYRIPPKTRNLKEFKKQLYKLIKDNSYDHVLRVTSNAAGLMDLKIAKKAGAKVCVARSSNSSDGNSIKQKVAHLLGKLLYLKYVDVAIAPSKLAGAYTFGKKNVQNGNVIILPNAVDLDVFKFSEENRKKIRAEFGVQKDTFLVGHIGRFAKQKNHIFLADIFKEIKNKYNNSAFIIVGKGELEDQFKEKIKSLKINDDVIYAGIRSDIPAILSAMDVLVFPSLYEGMPNTVIEAQATGLPCVISDIITREANITGLVEYISLEELSQKWATKAIGKMSNDRKDTRQDFTEKGYTIESAVQIFIKLVFKD